MQDLCTTRTETARKNPFLAQPGKLKYLIGGLIVALAVGYLIWSAVSEATAYYLTIPEIVNRGPSPRTVRVAGTVVEGSIDWAPRDLRLQFEISDGHPEAHVRPLQAIYHGPRPDMFRDGADVVLEGTYTSAGVFEAQTMLLQCPSKYEEAQ
jgi:cytochrome c-type biogenesis protein CcmE